MNRAWFSTGTFVSSAVIATLAMLQGCGTASFSGLGGSKDPPGKDPGSEDGYAYSLDWQWPCGEADSSSQETETGLLIQGGGDHAIASKYNRSMVTISGDVCSARNISRDIVFVIDVSGSMYSLGGLFGNKILGNDPYVNGTCARYEAVRGVIQSVKNAGDARFAVVTFSDNRKEVSTGMFGSESQLFADLVSGSSHSSIAALLCAGGGGTNYEDALEASEEILARERNSGRVQEVYFVSDGEPDPASMHGKAVAERIRQKATIATVMVGSSNDDVLKNGLASKDGNDRPLHARAEYASELTKVLQGFSSNRIAKASFNYAASGSKDSQDVDLEEFIGTDVFSFEAFIFDQISFPDGVSVELRYEDRFGNVIKEKGSLTWGDQ